MILAGRVTVSTFILISHLYICAYVGCDSLFDSEQECAASQEVSCIQEGLLSLDDEDKVLDPAKADQDNSGAAPDQEANEMTCAICLEQIALEDMCIVKGCEHVYCGIATLCFQCIALYCCHSCRFSL